MSSEKHRKRDLKQSPFNSAERATRTKRIESLIELIKSYDNLFDDTKFKRAFAWSEKYLRECQVTRASYPFPDPLKVAEYLAKRDVASKKEPASADTITAAILFPFASPTKDKDFSAKVLGQIGGTFGDRVEYLVTRAIQCDSFELLKLLPGHVQTEQEHLIEGRRAMMQVAEDEEVLELRGAYRVVNFMDMFQEAQKQTLDRDFITTECKDIRDLFAPVAYRAGLEYLRYDLLDGAFRVEEPERYERVKQGIVGDVTAPDMAEVHQQISEFAIRVAIDLGVDPKLITIRAREKSAPSTDAKTVSKNQAIAQLGDLLGFQLEIDEKLYLPAGRNFEDLTRKEQGDLLFRLGLMCHQFYDRFSDEFGRNSLDPSLIDQFKLLAALDPHPTTPGVDDRYDDYINAPKQVSDIDGLKPSLDLGIGYSALQDTFIFRTKSGKLVVMEGQIFDSLRGKNNKNHPIIGHVSYKTGIVLDAFMRDWFSNAKARKESKPTKPGPVFVYNDKHELFMLPPNATIRVYAGVVFGNKPIPAGLEAVVDNDDPTANRTRKTPYALSLELANGDRISLQAGPRI